MQEGALARAPLDESTRVAADSHAPSPETERTAVTIPAPRHRLSGRLDPLWELSSSESDSVLLSPNDVQFAHGGLLVFDAGARRIRMFDAATGRHTRSTGGEGQGPGEFSESFWFMGALSRPAAFDAFQHRVVSLEDPDGGYVTRPLPAGRRWISACALDDRRIIGSALNRQQPDFFVAEGTALVDSVPIPWPEFSDEHFLVRQSFVRQLDDTSCVMLAAYQRRFATYDGRSGFLSGTFIESADVVRAVVQQHAEGGGGTTSLPPGTRRGPLDARGWRDAVLVLFGGRSVLAHRLLDVYRRSDLAYEGSVVLPFRADRIAVHGDTIAVIGERDDYPVLAVFVLTQTSPRRFPSGQK